MLRAEGIRMFGSKEANFFRKFYRILCGGFLPSARNVGWFIITCLGIAEKRILLLCQLSQAWTISRQSVHRLSSDRYHIEINKCTLAFAVTFVSRVPLGRFNVVSVVMPYVSKQVVCRH